MLSIDGEANPDVAVAVRQLPNPGIKNGRVEKTEIELGLRDDQTETVEARSGVVPGDTLLLGTARGITPGTPVKVSTPNDTKR